MVVRLRLQRFGRKHSPFYRMVAADSRAPRDGKFLELVSSPNFSRLLVVECRQQRLDSGSTITPPQKVVAIQVFQSYQKLSFASYAV